MQRMTQILVASAALGGTLLAAGIFVHAHTQSPLFKAAVAELGFAGEEQQTPDPVVTPRDTPARESRPMAEQDFREDGSAEPATDVASVGRIGPSAGPDSHTPEAGRPAVALSSRMEDDQKSLSSAQPASFDKPSANPRGPRPPEIAEMQAKTGAATATGKLASPDDAHANTHGDDASRNPAENRVADVQTELLFRDYDPGVIDGLMGPRTRAALRQFQQDQGWRPTGRIDSVTLRALGIEALSDDRNEPAPTPVSLSTATPGDPRNEPSPANPPAALAENSNGPISLRQATPMQ